MIIIKNQRGITLIALVLTIAILLILATVGVQAGISSIEHSKMVNFVSRMQLLQKKVDFLAENGGYENLGEDVDELSDNQKNRISSSIENENIDTKNWGRLPSIYQEVEYLESTGIQYILTDIIPTNNSGIYAKVRSKETASDSIFFGSKGNSYSRFWGGNVSNRVYFGWNGITNNDLRPQIIAGDMYEIKMNYLNDRKLVVNNQEVDNNIVELSSNNTYPITIFAGNNEGTAIYKSSIILYEFKISQGENIINNFVPCYRKTDNKPGLYDLANNIFYINENNTGEDFNVGPIVSTVKTDTISNTTDILPVIYQQIKYLESTGTQYITTSILPSNDIGIYAKMVSLNIQNDLIYFGSRKDSNTRMWVGSNNGKFYFGWNNLTDFDNRPNINVGDVGVIQMNFLNNRTNLFNSNTIESNITNLGNNGYPIAIFAGNDAGTISYKSSMRLYRLKISKDTKITNDFIPCYRKSDNKPGMYDLIGNKFYTNQGTGEFEVGPDVNNSTIITNNSNPIRYFDSAAIAEDLGLENIDDEIVVNFATREVISLNGVKYDGKMYYSQYSLPGGQTVKQNTTAISRQIGWEDFTITPNINGLNATFTISGIGLANGTLSYSNDNKETWIEITNYTVAGENVTTQNITKSGIYFFRWVDNTNKNNIYLLNDDGISLKLTNSPELKGDLGERSPNYNYSDLTTEEGSTNWAYATDSVTEYIYVWIPRFAYETEDTTNIEFLRGTSLVTTSDKYLPESGWSIPEPLKEVKGIWVKVTAVDADNTGIISDLIDNDLSNLTIL